MKVMYLLLILENIIQCKPKEEKFYNKINLLKEEFVIIFMLPHHLVAGRVDDDFIWVKIILIQRRCSCYYLP